MTWVQRSALAGAPGESFAGEFPSRARFSSSVTYNSWSMSQTTLNALTTPLFSASGTEITFLKSGVVRAELYLYISVGAVGAFDGGLALNGTSVSYYRFDKGGVTGFAGFLSTSTTFPVSAGDTMYVTFRPQGANAYINPESALQLTRLAERVNVE